MHKTNEEVLKEILEQSLAGYWDWDLLTGYEYLSPSLKKMFGYEDHEIENTAEAWQRLVFAEDLPGVFEKYNQHIESKGKIPYYNEVRYHHKNGSTVWVICTGKVIEWDEDGNAMRMVGCHVDITERRRAEEVLRESEKRFHALFENAPLGYQSLDSDGRFLEINRAWLETLGYSREEVIGRWFGDFLVPEHVQAFRERFPVFKAQGSVHSEFYMLHKDGSRRYIAFDGQIGHNADGSFKQTHCILKDETTRKLIENELRETRERLELATKSAQLGIWDWDVVNDKLIWDDQMFNIYGITGEPTSSSVDIWRKRLHEDDSILVWEACVAALAGKGLYDLEFRIRTADGQIKFIKADGIVLRDKIGTPSRMIGVNQDITARKKAEEVLRTNEADRKVAEAVETERRRFFGVLEALPPLICLITKDHRVVFANHSYRQKFGDVYSKPCYKANFNVNEPCRFCKAFTVFETGQPAHWEISGPDGSIFEVHNFPFTDADGTQMVLEMDIDITERRKTELELHNYRDHLEQLVRERTSRLKETNVQLRQEIARREQTETQVLAEKERLSVTLRSIGDGVITTDINGNIVLINKIAEELTGWNQQEAEGKSLDTVFRIINESTREPHGNPVQKVLSTGKVIELANHTLLISRDDTERVIAYSGASIKDKAGEIIGVVLVFRDMTEKQKFLEITQNTQKLESLGVLAGGIAHDFNNLLGGIYGYIDMAAGESTESALVSRYLAKSMATIERARDLTRQLLTFAKGGDPVQKVEQLFPFVQETVQFVLSGSNVTSHFDVPQDLWACNFDKNQLGQVIDNIIINAQQAMPMGGTITVTARNITIAQKEHPILSSGNHVRLSIKDTGIGIPREMLARIFDPFFTTKAKGHGLGLATCYSIINRHNGCIDVDSEPGKGSVFHVYLPAAEGMAISATREHSGKHKGSGTFLVMDDEEVIRETIGDMLRSFGYSVVCKDNGEDVVDYVGAEIKANRPLSGMIFDLTIPGGMGGKEAIVEIRKLSTEIPVFVSSGYADGPVMKNPVEYGFTASICKPFRRVELMEMLEKYMKTGS